jgi:excisionase family DNA binding protein
MQKSESKRALTIEEFAERWRIGRNSVYNAIARGELGSVKIGKRRVITMEQEEAFRKLKEGEAAQ